MKSLALTLALSLTALIVALPMDEQPAHAQSAGVQASDLIRELTKRSTLPPVAARAKLETVEADICRELGEQVAEAEIDTARKVAGFMAESSNARAHAALLYSLASDDAEKQRICLDMLAQLPFRQIPKLRAAAEELSPTLIKRVRDAGFLDLLDRYVEELCDKSNASGYTPFSDLVNQEVEGALIVGNDRVRERQLCLALLVDVVEGEGGFRILIDSIIKHLVGEDNAEFIADIRHRRELLALAEEQAAREAMESIESDDDAASEAVDDGSDEQPEPELEEAEPITPEEEERYRDCMEIERRRIGARSMFKELLLLDPDRSGRTLGNYDFDDRQASAEAWWDDYERAFGSTGSWVTHLNYLRKPNEFADGATWRVMILMDELCGGVRVQPPAPENDEEGKEITALEPIAIFEGEDALRIVHNFEQLPAREQRARKKALFTRFGDLFGSDEDE